MDAARPAHPGFDARWVAWIAAAAIAVHVGVFLAHAANPLVVSDAWYFVDAFLRKYVEGDLAPGDFFAKRSAVDHSLPFHKLVMLANYEWFGLDLAVDAWVGFAFALGAAALFRRVLRQSAGEAFATWPVQLAWVAATATYVSLNATHIFEWPMLTLSYATMFFTFCLFVACRRAVDQARWFGVVPAVALVLLALDNGGVITVLAAILATGLFAVRTGRTSRGVVLALGLLGAILAYRIGYALLAPPTPGGPVARGATFAAMLAKPGALVDVIAALRWPLVAGVLHPEHLVRMFGATAKAAGYALVVLLAAAHAWFWLQALTRRPSPAWHLAIALMLVFYGLTAGVLIGRVPEFGIGVFTQPRYVVFYQLHMVALALMAGCWFAERARVAPRAWSLPLVALCVGVLLLQWPLDREAWAREPFARRYVEQLAVQMDQLADAPEVAPDKCLPMLTVCRMPPGTRVRAVDFLKDHRLNLYSEDFRRRHDFAPAE